jgi:hypothetical protein
MRLTMLPTLREAPEPVEFSSDPHVKSSQNCKEAINLVSVPFLVARDLDADPLFGGAGDFTTRSGTVES